MRTQRVNSVVFAGNDSLLVSGSYDKCVKVWDCRSLSIDAVQTMADAHDSVTAVAASGPALYAASVDGCVRCYDARRGTATTDRLGVPVCSLALSHDGRCYAAATLDSRVRLLDRAGGRVLATYAGHTSTRFVAQCGLSFDDARVLCGSEDGALLCWDVLSERVLCRQRACGTAVLGALCPHPTTHDALAGYHDGSVVLWRSSSSSE